MNNSICSTAFQTPAIRLSFRHVKALKNRFILTLSLVFSVFIAHAQWKQLATTTPAIPTNKHVLSIHFVNDNIGYVVGTGGLVSKTTDGGVIWTTQTNNIPSGAYIASTYFIDALTGFAVGDNDLIRRTEDGGVTWITITPTSQGQLITGQAYRAVWFYNAYEGYITGGVSAQSGIILKTTDGGKTWLNSPITPNNGNGIYGIFKKDPINVFAVDFDGRVLKSTDGGNTFPTISTTFAGVQLSSIYFLDAQVGYISGGKATTNQKIAKPNF